MQNLLLLGAEAVAQGAIDGGISGIYAYPGTPSTEIMEYIQTSKIAEERNIHRLWSSNEKTAMEAALGMSYAGKRAIVCMKHVGLNVAADAFVNSAITGVNGGLLVVVADDPSMHSSQNEQDSRFYGKFAMIPVLEPSNQQEAYDMAYSGFELSEKFKIPVLFRITTRISHSRSGIATKNIKDVLDGSLPQNPRKFVLLPAIAKINFNKLIEEQDKFVEDSENSEYNKYTDGKDKSLGIITGGIAYNYLLENFEDRKIPHPVLKINQYPIPRKLVEKIKNECKELLVIEEGAPFIEEMIKSYFNEGKQVHGKLDGFLPRVGELNPNLVAESLKLENVIGEEIPAIVKNRPPALCPGCGHRDMYDALNESMKDQGKGKVFADIGCYTLGALPPFNAINTCVDMGASITMAKGANDAGLVPAVAVIGDSTFTHSGMTGLLDAVNEKSHITVIISDNSTTAMTGGQDSQGTGKIEAICEGLGVEKEHIRVMIPLKKNFEENVKIIKEELAYNGVSVVIPRRECVQTLARRMKKAKA
ncbi:MAG: indolepyruvate ferredoxin oxidoreductase [Bacteroidetes bacterium]|nr:indolepyruvate ferredoxin oxidoreductase [Bacteroidota bacterium]